MASTQKFRQSRGWGAHFLERLDQSERWAPSAWWRPNRDERFEWKVMWKLFGFNLPLFLVPLTFLGIFLYKSWEQASGERTLNFEDPQSWIQFIFGVLICSVAIDFYACNALRVAWNRRVRKFELDES